MGIKNLFFPSHPPAEEEMGGSRRTLIVQGALASLLFSLGTTNFLAGYLTYLGASPALAAQIAAIPYLGCALQLVSPFLFERLRYRKLAITLLCFSFRFSLGLAVFAPLLFSTKTEQLRFVFIIYLFAFLVAGFVTPGLNQWVLQIAPNKNRGHYFAVKDISAAVVNAVAAFIMGRQVDHFSLRGNAYTGYLVVYLFCTILSVADAALMGSLKEPENPPAEHMPLADILRPIRNARYRPVLLYHIFWYIAFNFAGGFLYTYQIRVLGLSHTFITTVGIVSAAAGMGGIWLWGRIADRTYWHMVILATASLSACCYLGWFLVRPASAMLVTPVLMAVSSAVGGASGMAGLNLQYASAPREGKTTYLGLTSALASLAGYGSAMLGALIQRGLEGRFGGRSMAILYLVSALFAAGAVCYGIRKLPRKPMA
jgi:predicted MFS family arabinose efflux permease